jgi:hypothetical protein
MSVASDEMLSGVQMLPGEMEIPMNACAILGSTCRVSIQNIYDATRTVLGNNAA